MESPQKENGYTAINHESMEQLWKVKFGSEVPLQICLFVIRKTWGYGKKMDRISLTQFQKELGRPRKTISYWLNWLVTHLLLVKGVLPLGVEYGFNKDHSAWLVTGTLLVTPRAFTSNTPVTKTSNTPVTHKRKKETIQKKQRFIEFEKFWNLYRKKNDRHKCLKKFLSLKDSEIKKILQVVEAYVESTLDVKYRKNPLTWLNGRCWEDEIETKKSHPLTF